MLKPKIIYNYITTNTLNNKKYVGMHSAINTNNSYLGSGILLKKAIKKYGKEIFKKEILCVCESKEIAHENEKKYIEQYNSIQPNGYNIHPNGGLGLNDYHTEESCKKMSEKLKGRPAPNKGIKHSKETIAKMIKAKAKYKGKPGHKHTEEEKRNVGIANSKRIITDVCREKRRKNMLGRKASEATKEKMSKKRIGLNTWSKARKLTDEQIKHRNEVRDRNKLLKSKQLELC
jgi:group I intron endonuclease